MQLDHLAALAVFCGGRAFWLFEDPWMDELFTQGVGYKPPSRDRLAGTLLDQIYLETKEKVDALFEADNMINIVSDESNNQSGDRIMNMTVLTKDHQSFHAYSESAGSSKLDAHASAAWMLEKMTLLTDNHLEKINSIATDTCNLQCAVWDILAANPKLKHALFIPCDSHGL